MARDDVYNDGQYFEKNPTWHVEDSAWKARQILKILKDNNLEVIRICEIGCGAGEILNQLHMNLPENVQLSGYEISRQAYQMARTREKQRLRYFLEDFFTRDTPPFDLVLSIDVFEHVDDYLGFLRKLKDRGTYKIFHIPLDLSLQSVLRRKNLVNRRKIIGHLHYFTKETALETLKYTGYHIVDYFFTAGPLELSSKSFKSALIRMPRKILFKINKNLAARIMGGFSLLVLAE